jgi:hypothetical protein
MTLNQSDLDSFHNFATNVLAHANHDFSLEELVTKWREECELAATVQSIQRGVADVEAGRIHDLADVDARIRKELGFPGRRR